MRTLLFSLLLCSACQAQTTALEPAPAERTGLGEQVAQLGANIMVVHEDLHHAFWFGSWQTGLYQYKGKQLIHYTTHDGLANNRIDEIQEDAAGNLYLASYHPTFSLVQFDGKQFRTITPTPSTHWRLHPADLWFKHSYDLENLVYRYDGVTLHALRVPQPPNLPQAFAVYSIYPDRAGNLWFGTLPVGVCRYDGTTFKWITEEDVTEFRNEGANGVRSITEDKNGDFWFNTEYRYRIHDPAENTAFYTRIPSLGELDGKKNSGLNEYLSTVRDHQNRLWFVTYRHGVWMYDGTAIVHYPIMDNGEQVTLFSIYQDRQGNLWLGSHDHGAYRYNGQEFEPFEP